MKTGTSMIPVQVGPRLKDKFTY